MTYDEALKQLRTTRGAWITRRSWCDDDLDKKVTYAHDGRLFAEYGSYERCGYNPTPHDMAATDWKVTW